MTDPNVSDLQQRIESLGYTLPDAPKSVALYIPAKKHNGLVYTSGQLPIQENGELAMCGPLSAELSSTEKKRAAEALILCLVNAIAAVKAIQNLDDIQEIIRLGIFVQSDAQFHEHHLIANPVSQFAEKLFPASKHTRTTIGVIDLPLNSTVEMEALFALR